MINTSSKAHKTGGATMKNDEKIIEMLTQMQNDMKEMKSEISGINTRLDGIDKRLDGIDQRLDGIDVRLDRIEISVDATFKLTKETSVEVKKSRRPDGFAR
jgi:archaellum component FlaC